MRLIDADATIKDFTLNFGDVMDVVCAKRIIDRQPAIDPESLVVHGEWIRTDDPEFELGDFECSVCEYLECDVDTAVLMPGENCLYYCPNCGAKMDARKKLQKPAEAALKGGKD